MAVDISTELQTIGTALLGEEVRMAIADAMQKIMAGTLPTDISEELETIRYGRYGSDIRSAIYWALRKLANYEPPPQPSGDSVLIGVIIPDLQGCVGSLCGVIETEE